MIVQALSIMFHDVVEQGAWDTSGFPGEWPARYKLERADFERHLKAIREAIGGQPADAADRFRDWGRRRPLFLTFDDGGVSSYQRIAGMLELFGWPGHFFVTVDYIGKPGFLDAEQILRLRKRRHVIGSHSCSHPTRMAHCSWEQLRKEWRDSVGILSEILGEPVRVASVPGGYYARKVGEAAAAEGIEMLFTSEPTAACGFVSGCRLLGRYSVLRGMGPEVSAGFAAGRRSTCWKQAVWWKSKKAIKTLAGPLYVRLLKSVFSGRDSSEWT